MRAHADARPPWTPAGQSTGCGGLPPTRGSASKPPAGVWDDGRHGRTRIRPPRRHRRVRHAGRRRQGQGAQGRRPAGHRLRRRRTRLPHPRLHRRGRRRRGARPQEPPLHAGRRPAGAAGSDRRQDRPRHASTRSTPRRCWSPTAASRPSTTPSPPCCDPGDEVLLIAPYWTTYPEAIKLAGGVPVEVVTDETTGYLATVEQLEAARTDRTKVLLFVSPSNPDGRGLPAGPRSRPSARGRASTTCGSSPTRSTSTSSTATPRWSRSCTAPPATRSSSSTGWPRPTR